MTTQLNSSLPRVKIPVRQQQLTPKKFVEVYTTERDNIKSVRVIPPQLGRLNDYGKVEVSYKTLKLVD